MSLEFNKVAAAVLTAGIVAMSAGFVSQLLVSPEDIYEDAYPVEVTDGEPSEAPEAEEETLESVIALLGDADPENGESLTRACQACHTFEEGEPNGSAPISGISSGRAMPMRRASTTPMRWPACPTSPGTMKS
ncbi:hypothetical protein [Fodinicurvata halophila]|uniref:hypothetical protein n=1 Tax=Fodinicurvata halophila TaxID=1419723 RepID=UPI0036328496